MDIHRVLKSSVLTSVAVSAITIILLFIKSRQSNPGISAIIYLSIIIVMVIGLIVTYTHGLELSRTKRFRTATYTALLFIIFTLVLSSFSLLFV